MVFVNLKGHVGNKKLYSVKVKKRDIKYPNLPLLFSFKYLISNWSVVRRWRVNIALIEL